MNNTFLLAGLGNPGKKYEFTRHNIGFHILDQIAHAKQSPITKKNAFSLYSNAFSLFDGQVKIILLKPQQYMNLSGNAVAQMLQFFKLPLQNLLVIHDEVELGFADIQFKYEGGHRGHNGLRDIIAHLQTGNFARMRFGVGKPASSENGLLANYLLQKFFNNEIQELPPLLEKAENLCYDWISQIIQKKPSNT